MNSFTRTMGGVALTAMLALTATPVSALAQDTEIERSIEGSWTNQITPRDCQSGAPLLPFTIPGLLTFHKGGTTSETAVSPGGPASRSPGHGIWSRRNGTSFGGSFVFMTFSPNGTFTGMTKVTQNLQLNATGDGFYDRATVEIFDANGNVIATGCATAVGTRFK